MFVSKITARLLLATLLTPQVAVGAIIHRKAPERVAVSAELLDGLWGGAYPATKIGATGQFGMLTVRRIDGSCPGDFIATKIAPSNAGGCNQSIPFFLSNEDVWLELGGNAATPTYLQSPHFVVYVNGTIVPSSQLGPNFNEVCPRLAEPWGTATVNGIDLALYSCAAGGFENLAVIPSSMLRHGELNSIAVRYGFLEPALAHNGDDLDTRIIYHQ